MSQSKVRQGSVSTFMSHVYAFLSLGLATTALTSYTISSVPEILTAVSTPWIFISLIIAEFYLVFRMASSLNSMTFTRLGSIFALFSILNGATLTPLLMYYTGESIATAFILTTSTVVIMSVVGFFTKKDFGGLGNFFLASLIGLIVVMVANIFIMSSSFSVLISCFAVFLFTGLISYDTQRTKQSYRPGIEETQEGLKLALRGALDIYLDFLNLFIHLLSLLGGSND